MFFRSLSQKARPMAAGSQSPADLQPIPFDYESLLCALEAFVDQQAEIIQELAKCEDAA